MKSACVVCDHSDVCTDTSGTTKQDSCPCQETVSYVFGQNWLFLSPTNFDLRISCDRPCLELQNASLSFDIDCFLVKL